MAELIDDNALLSPDHHFHFPRSLRAAATCISSKIMSAAGKSWCAGDVAAGLSLAETAVRASCNLCAEPCSSFAGLHLALLLISIRRLDKAQHAVHQATSMTEDPRLGAIATLLKARIALIDGRLDEAAELCETGLCHANRLRLSSWTPIGNLVQATVALRRGELATMIHYANQLKEDAVFCRETFPSNTHPWLIVQTTEAEKGREAAARLTRELLESESATRRLLLAEPTSVPFLVRIMRATNEWEPAVRGAQYAAALATENPDVRSLTAGALHAEGILRGDVDTLRRAAESYDDLWARASVSEDIGKLLAIGGETHVRVREVFELAMHSYADAGSLRDSSRVRSRLRGLDVSAPASRFWPPSRIPALTDTEYTVAKLVSKGLTNGQVAGQMYLSRHTVAFHLRKIFQKIGVRSRLELAVIWNDLDNAQAVCEGSG